MADKSISNQNIYRQCSISVMDTIADPDISFDKDGICNYYYDYKKAEDQFVLKGESARQIGRSMRRRRNRECDRPAGNDAFPLPPAENR